MRALILQHEMITPAGSVLEWLTKNNIAYEIVCFYKQHELPQLNTFDFLFICGGTMNVDQEAQLAWLKVEKEFIRQALSSHKKIVGLCLGSQLLAECLGAKVKPMQYSEVGWHSVRLSYPVEQNLKVFQWHSYCFEASEHFKIIASNTAWNQQALLYKDQAIGFQFHPESTQEWVEQCCEEQPWPTGSFCQSREEILSQSSLLQPLMQEWFFKTLDFFLLKKVVVQNHANGSTDNQ